MKHRGGLNVFAALEELSEQLLAWENSEVLCRYGELLRFRKISQYVEEDLLVCAYLAVRCRRYGKRHKDFGWDFAIGHNNTQLDRIMEKGISENHFHLFGSAPSFHLIWIYFMNDADYAVLAEWDKRVAEQRRMTREHYGSHYSEEPFERGVLKAAFIRVCLVYYLMGRDGRTEGVSLGRGGTDSQEEDVLFTDIETEKNCITVGLNVLFYLAAHAIF